MISGILLDLSGVLYVGDHPLEGVAESLNRLKDTGIPIRYVTNTSRKPATEILRQLLNMGFNVESKELFTAPMAAHSYLKTRRLFPYMLIHKNLRPAGASPRIHDDFDRKSRLRVVQSVAPAV